jgi:hypothetical protein
VEVGNCVADWQQQGQVLLDGNPAGMNRASHVINSENCPAVRV